MKTSQLLGCYGCLCAAVFAGEPMVVSSVSAPESRETRRSSAIAPSSGVSLQEAEKVAAEVQRAVPGTTVFMVNPTGSMRPLFDGNCLLLTEKAAFGTLEVGDIVVFRHSRTGKLIVHRILERRAAGYWAKGDHNDRMDDDLITETNYCGRIYGIIYTTRSGENIAQSAQKNLRLYAAAP